jgi:hypothetical protein
MSDVADGIGTEAARQRQNRQRARELPGPIWGWVRAAAHAGDGAVLVERNGGPALTTFRLSWRGGKPDRALEIAVDEAAGAVRASWVATPGYGKSADARSVEASRFNPASLATAIALLVDRRRWARGAVPTIPW